MQSNHSDGTVVHKKTIYGMYMGIKTEKAHKKIAKCNYGVSYLALHSSLFGPDGTVII